MPDIARLTGHARIDMRSVAMHRAMAEKIRLEPALLTIAHDNLKRWMAEPGHSQPYFEEWQRILATPIEDILAVMVEDSELMTALRQCTPFAGVLTPRERWKIYDAFATGTCDSSGSGDCQ